jgi:hypothetical protein
MESHAITDSQISAQSTYQLLVPPSSFPAWMARPNLPGPLGPLQPSWRPLALYHWLKVDLLIPHTITALGTQRAGLSYVTMLNLEHGSDGQTWQTISVCDAKLVCFMIR